MHGPGLRAQAGTGGRRGRRRAFHAEECDSDEGARMGTVMSLVEGQGLKSLVFKAYPD